MSKQNYHYTIALAGNPNTGKTTVFNMLTGMNQHTGNWPGKTVTRSSGFFNVQKLRCKLIDLPGTYSLLSKSTDEEIARDYILFQDPTVTLVVMDAGALERNLNLCLQILQITSNVIVCLNLIDEAKRKGIQIDHKKLSKELGVPVVPMIAAKGVGKQQLLDEIAKACVTKPDKQPLRVDYPPELNKDIERIAARLKEMDPELQNAEWLALRLIEGDPKVIKTLESAHYEYIR